jgi:peptide/nickel transport system substrate-binding protein
MASSNRTSDMVASLDWENATIVDDYTVEFPVVSYDAALVSYLGNASFGAVDKETHEADSDWAWIVGTGPYVLSEWEESVRYVLTRNENYRGEAPLYDEIDIYFFTEESTRYAEFQSGNLDAIRLSEASYVNSLKSGTVSFASILTVEDSAVNGFSLASGEGTTGAFADINLRKALAHCLDINSIVESLGEGVYTVPDSLVSEDCWAYLAGTGAYEYDEAAAIEYLAAAGYSVDNPVTIAVYAESTAWNSAILEAAQSYAAKIGINLDLTGVADFSTILPALIAGENDMSISSPSSATSMDPAALLQQAGPNSDNSCLRVNDPELGQLYLDAASSHDQAERLELYKEFMQGYHDQYLFIPVYMAAYSYGYNSEHASFADAIDNSSYPDLTKVVD